MRARSFGRLLILAILVMALESSCAKTESTAVPVESQPTALDVKTISLVVQQEFTEVPARTDLDIEGAVKRVLERMGLRVVEMGQPADAAMEFQLAFVPLPAEVDLGIGKALCYNGAEVTGQMTLARPGEQPQQIPVKHTHEPETMFLIGCPKIEEAPFGEVWAPAVLDAMSQIWDHPILVKTIEGDADPILRTSAIDLLSVHQPRPTEASSVVSNALNDPDDSVASLAAIVLGTWKDESAVPSLIQALEREDTNTKQMVIYALGQMGPAAMDAVPALIPVLGESDQFVQGEASVALKKITGQDFGKDQARWQDWWDAQ